MNIKQMYCIINMIESSIILKVWWGLGWPPSKGQTPPPAFYIVVNYVRSLFEHLLKWDT